MKYIRVPLTNLLRIKSVVSCFTEDADVDYEAKPEKHNFWEMVYLRRGHMYYLGGETKGHMSAGELILHAPKVVHALGGDGKHPFSFFIVSFYCDSPAMQALAGRPIRVPPHLTHLLDDIIKERKDSFLENKVIPLVARDDAPLGGQQMLGLYLEQLLIGVLRENEKYESTGLFDTREKLERQLAADIRDYLEEHLFDDLKMQELCDRFHYGKSRLSEVFRNVYGDSVMHWYLRKKIAVAGRMLLDGEGSITEISAHLQFDSPQYFSRIFKRYMGVCPRDYLSKNRSNT